MTTMLDDGLAWPWCDACHSWHHPHNPTCRYRDPLYLQKLITKRLLVRGMIKFTLYVSGTIIAAILCGWGLALITR